MRADTIIAALMCTIPAQLSWADPVPSSQFAQFMSASCDPLPPGAEYVEHIGIHTTYQLPSPMAGQTLYALTSGDNSCHLLLQSYGDPDGTQTLWLSNQATHALTTAVFEDKVFMVFVTLNDDAFQSYVTAQMADCQGGGTTVSRDDCIERVRDEVRTSVAALSWAPSSEGGAYYSIGLFGHQFSHYDDPTLLSARDLATDR